MDFARAFPILENRNTEYNNGGIRLGLYMWQTAGGSRLSLESMGPPVVDGAAIAVTIFYVLLMNIVFIY